MNRHSRKTHRVHTTYETCLTHSPQAYQTTAHATSRLTVALLTRGREEMRAVHLFLVTVVGACSAKSVHQQGPNSPTRVHSSPGRARHPPLSRSGQVQQPWGANLCALFQPPLLLGDSHRLMARAEQVVCRKHNNRGAPIRRSKVRRWRQMARLWIIS